MSLPYFVKTKFNNFQILYKKRLYTAVTKGSRYKCSQNCNVNFYIVGDRADLSGDHNNTCDDKKPDVVAIQNIVDELFEVKKEMKQEMMEMKQELLGKIAGLEQQIGQQPKMNEFYYDLGTEHEQLKDKGVQYPRPSSFPSNIALLSRKFGTNMLGNEQLAEANANTLCGTSSAVTGPKCPKRSLVESESNVAGENEVPSKIAKIQPSDETKAPQTDEEGKKANSEKFFYCQNCKLFGEYGQVHECQKKASSKMEQQKLTTELHASGAKENNGEGGSRGSGVE